MSSNPDDYWLIDPNEHNALIEVGKTYRIPFDYEYDDHISPFRGLEVTVLSISHYTRAGFDCFVKVDCTPEQLADRYSLVFGSKYTVEEVVEWHGHESYYFETPLEEGLYLEHDTFQLELIEQEKESENG